MGERKELYKEQPIMNEENKDWTKEEWKDLCDICNPNDTKESIEALRKHDNRILYEYTSKLRDLWDFTLVPPSNPQEQINMVRFQIEELIKEVVERPKK